MPLIFDQLLPIPTTATLRYESEGHGFTPSNDSETFINVSNSIQRLTSLISRLVNIEELELIRDSAASFLELIQSDISYQNQPENQNSDSACKDVREFNERLQGRTLFERQQKLAQLIRQLKFVGLDPLKVNYVNSESLTIKALTDWEAHRLSQSDAVIKTKLIKIFYFLIILLRYLRLSTTQPHIGTSSGKKLLTIVKHFQHIYKNRFLSKHYPILMA